nr:hypothetical protein [Tanacetum cinerariifolium]
KKKVQENMMVMCSSPMDPRFEPNGSGTLDVVRHSPRPYNMMKTGGEDDGTLSSLWSLMFQDMKPT